MNGGQQVVGGLLAYCFSLIGNGYHIKSFQALFLTYGCISVLWGIFVILWMPDSPMRAKCFNEDDKRLMIERVRSNQTGLQNKQFRAYQVLEAFRDPQVYCYMAIQIFTTLPTSGLANFANIVIESFEFSVLQTQLLSMVLGFYIIIVLFTTLFLIKKTGQNLYIMLGFITPYVPIPIASFPHCLDSLILLPNGKTNISRSYVGTFVLMTVENKNFATKIGLLISYYITMSFWAAQTLGLSMVSRNIGGATKKSAVIATTFVSWAVGNSIGIIHPFFYYDLQCVDQFADLSRPSSLP